MELDKPIMLSVRIKDETGEAQALGTELCMKMDACASDAADSKGGCSGSERLVSGSTLLMLLIFHYLW